MEKTAEQVCAERRARLEKVAPEMRQLAWLREIADELTQLRYDLRASREAK